MPYDEGILLFFSLPYSTKFPLDIFPRWKALIAKRDNLRFDFLWWIELAALPLTSAFFL